MQWAISTHHTKFWAAERPLTPSPLRETTQKNTSLFEPHFVSLSNASPPLEPPWAAPPWAAPPWLCLAVIILLASIGCHRPAADRETTQNDKGSVTSDSDLRDERLSLATEAIAQRQFVTAEDALKQCLLADPSDNEALELSADLAVLRGDARTAIALYQAVIDAQGRDADRELLDKWAKSLLRAGRPYDAIEALEELGNRFPNDSQSRYDLAGMAAAFGVPEQAVPALRWLVQRGQSDPQALQLLADPARVEPDVESCQKLLSVSDDDRRAEFGLARLDAINEDWEAVERRLTPIVKQQPQFAEAYALYGQAIFELGHHEKLLDWRAKTPESALNSSRYWATLGRWEQSRGEHQAAAIAFWESMRRQDVLYPEVLTLLSISLTQIERTDDAAKLAELITKHSELRDALKIHLERSGQSQKACLRVADAMLSLGRLWEAEAWARIAVSLPDEKIHNLRERYLSIRGQLTVETPWQLPEANAATLVDLSELPRSFEHNSPTTAPLFSAAFMGPILLANEARERGWVHTSIPASKNGGYTIEQTLGGGVAVIDIDCDGWPDLAAATLDGQALQNNSSPNRLFRNLNGNYVDASEPAGYRDHGFSHGIAVADYNDDGFADLFDANIGRNRLFRNNGDGTFTDVSDEVGLHGETWTTSAALIDLDGDGILDLFEVNYCAGKAPYERKCFNKRGLGTCSPLLFDAEPDRVWKGRADGTFTEVTADWIMQTSPGRGLGIVAGQLDELAGIDVLVGNDMTVNHLWSPRFTEPGFRIVDIGLPRGLGTSGKSNSQASMGIAAADADGDGDLDFLMTHFSNDYNTFYEQIAPGFWSDRSYPRGFAESSMKLLGFGTQWIDFDNGGGLELIIANGHVDQLSSDDVAYRMPAQVYSRTTNGRWEELERSALGEYFRHDHLGRAMVWLDANRDGRCDVAITHLGDPAALLINRSENAGRAIALELRATSSPREAVGARVTAMVGNRKVVSHLTTGDGYMASNQRLLHIGCGSTSSVEDVTVFWPSGKTESFGSLSSAREYLLVEGSGEAFELWNHP